MVILTQIYCYNRTNYTAANLRLWGFREALSYIADSLTYFAQQLNFNAKKGKKKNKFCSWYDISSPWQFYEVYISAEL
jgi:hypothetical protein